MKKKKIFPKRKRSKNLIKSIFYLWYTNSTLLTFKNYKNLKTEIVIDDSTRKGCQDTCIETYNRVGTRSHNNTFRGHLLYHCAVRSILNKYSQFLHGSELKVSCSPLICQLRFNQLDMHAIFMVQEYNDFLFTNYFIFF